MNPRLLPPAAVARSVLRTQSDARLAELVSGGSEPAFEAIVSRYRRSLVRHCARVVGEADAEEAAQDALMKAHAALLRGDPVRRLAPWLHVIAHNTALSYLRTRATRPRLADVDYECGCTVDTSAEYREELSEVLDAVRALPDRQRSAIVMREFEGRSYDEIAERLGSSHGAVRQLLNRARSSVRERLGALVPVGLLARLALAGTGGGEVAGGATLSGACAIGAKVCVAAVIPATVAIVASAPAPRDRTPTRETSAAATTTALRQAGNATGLPPAMGQVSFAGRAVWLAAALPRSGGGGAGASSGTFVVMSRQRRDSGRGSGASVAGHTTGWPARGAGSSAGAPSAARGGANATGASPPQSAGSSQPGSSTAGSGANYSGGSAGGSAGQSQGAGSAPLSGGWPASVPWPAGGRPPSGSTTASAGGTNQSTAPAQRVSPAASQPAQQQSAGAGTPPAGGAA